MTRTAVGKLSLAQKFRHGSARRVPSGLREVMSRAAFEAATSSTLRGADQALATLFHLSAISLKCNVNMWVAYYEKRDVLVIERFMFQIRVRNITS